MNPNGGSVALGHPFGATGARILSQAVKELSAHGRPGSAPSSASAPTAARAASSCWKPARSSVSTGLRFACVHDGANIMPNPVSLLDELRTQYEAARQSTPPHADVEDFQQIDGRLRKAFRWLEKADDLSRRSQTRDRARISISGTASCSNRRDSRTARSGSMSAASSGFPVLEEINIRYEIHGIESARSRCRARQCRGRGKSPRRSRASLYEPPGRGSAAERCTNARFRCRPRFRPR